MAHKLAGIFVAFFGTYFLVYPVLYFIWNFFIVGINYPQYRIPDFWVGMAGYFIFNVIKNTLKGK